jgi:hypothetical protein
MMVSPEPWAAGLDSGDVDLAAVGLRVVRGGTGEVFASRDESSDLPVHGSLCASALISGWHPQRPSSAVPSRMPA